MRAEQGQSYVGVKSTNILCLPDCHYLKRAHQKNMIMFSSFDEGLNAGYRKCKKCFDTIPKLIRDTIKCSHFKYEFQTAIGKITLLHDDHHLYQVFLDNQSAAYQNSIDSIPDAKNHEVAEMTEQMILDYFAEKPVDFRTLPFKLTGTVFQKEIFQLMLEIPYGSTPSYQDFTSKYFTPNKLRAVSGQIGKNPLPIVIPCHRIVGAGGKLTGYLGGIEVKKYLLDLEQGSK